MGRRAEGGAVRKLPAKQEAPAPTPKEVPVKKERAPRATPEKKISLILGKPPGEWTEGERELMMQNAAKFEEVISSLEDLREMKKAFNALIRKSQEAPVEGLPEDSRMLLAEFGEIMEKASSIPEDEKEAFFLQTARRFGFDKAGQSDTTAKVADLIFNAQHELEQRGLPLPQEVATFKSEERWKEIAKNLAGSIPKTIIGIAEGGTIATAVLLLRQELWGQHFTFLSPEHLGSTALTIALTTPFIELGAGAAIGDPIQRGGSYRKNIKSSMRRYGPLAIALAGAATLTSPLVQTQTLAVSLGNAVEMSGVTPLVKSAKESIEKQIVNLGPAGMKVVEQTQEAEAEIIDAEITGVQKAGRGGTGKATLGPAAAFKIGYLTNGVWGAEEVAKYGAIPQTEKTQAALALGQKAREGILKATLSEDIAELYRTFESETKDERAEIVKRFLELGATAQEIDFWMSNPLMVKATLTVGYSVPGQPVVDKQKEEALRPLAVLQERHAKLVAEVNALLKATSDGLTKAAAEAGRTEGSIDIKAETISFDTSALQNIEVPTGLSLTDPGTPYTAGAEHYFGEGDMFRTTLYATLLTGTVLAILFGSKALISWRNRRRYQRLIGEAEEGYAYTAENETGYLAQFANLMSERLSALFASDAGILGNTEMKAQLKEMVDRDWMALTPEMVRVALMEAIADMDEIRSTGAQNPLEGLMHAYGEGWKHLISRGTPPEVIAQNAVTELLKNRSDLAVRMVKKLFPGFYELEQFLETKKGAPANEQDVAELDSHLYPMIASHLERRLEVEETKLEWCRGAYERFLKDGTFEELGVGSLEDLNEAPIDLKSTESFETTGLNAEKLAGSAVRRAFINTIAGRMKEARESIEKVRDLSKGLKFSSQAKSQMLKSPRDRSVYRTIDARIDKLEEVDSIREVGDEGLAGFTPRGTLEIAAKESVISAIREQMGTLAEEETQEDFAELHERIGRQFNALSAAAKRLWSWENIPVPQITASSKPQQILRATRSALLRDSVGEGYRQQVVFRVIEADEETPAPSYGVEFSIIHKETGEEVTSVRYSLAQTFSEVVEKDKIEKEIADNFGKKVGARGMYNASMVYADRTERALASAREKFGERMKARDINLGGKKVAEELSQYFNEYVPHTAGHTRLRHLEQNFASLRPDLPTPKSEVEDNAEVEEGERMDVEVASRFRELAESVEKFAVPQLGIPMTQAQLEGIASQLQTEALRGARVIFMPEDNTVRVTKPGVFGSPVGAKTRTVRASEFKNAYEDRAQNLKSTINALFAKTTR